MLSVIGFNLFGQQAKALMLQGIDILQKTAVKTPLDQQKQAKNQGTGTDQHGDEKLVLNADDASAFLLY